MIIFITSRFLRIAPVYLFCSIVSLCIVLVLPSVFSSSHRTSYFTLGNLISSFIFLGYNSQPAGPLGPAWSLDVELQFYIIAPLIFMGINRFPLLISLCMIALGAVSSVVCGGYSVISFLPIFLMGILYCRFKKVVKIFDDLKNISIILTVIVLVIFVSTPFFRPIIFGGAHPGKLFAYNELFNFFLALVVMPFVLSTVLRESSKVDRLLSDMSFSLYLFHWIPLLYVSYYFPEPALQLRTERAFNAAIIFFLTFFMSWAITVVIDRPMARVRQRIFSNR